MWDKSIIGPNKGMWKDLEDASYFSVVVFIIRASF
jgi:hypothetical protein